MKSKKLIRQTSTSASERQAKVDIAVAPPRLVSELNANIADLLFDVQSEWDRGSVDSQRKAADGAKTLLQQLALESPTLMGLMGKCTISGCDVHTLTVDGDIAQHFNEDHPVPPEFEKARSFLSNAATSIVGVIVYSDGSFDVVLLDGSIKKQAG